MNHEVSLLHDNNIIFTLLRERKKGNTKGRTLHGHCNNKGIKK